MKIDPINQKLEDWFDETWSDEQVQKLFLTLSQIGQFHTPDEVLEWHDKYLTYVRTRECPCEECSC